MTPEISRYLQEIENLFTGIIAGESNAAPFFRRLCARGERLVALHLMRYRPPLSARFPIAGTDRAESVFYKDACAAIPATQGFDKVPADLRAFRIGGYQVCENGSRIARTAFSPTMNSCTISTLSQRLPKPSA